VITCDLVGAEKEWIFCRRISSVPGIERPRTQLYVAGLVWCLQVITWPNWLVTKRCGSEVIYPYPHYPGRLMVESRIALEVLTQLAEMGHRIIEWEDFSSKGGCVSIALINPHTGSLEAAADPRREGYSVGY